MFVDLTKDDYKQTKPQSVIAPESETKTIAYGMVATRIMDFKFNEYTKMTFNIPFALSPLDKLAPVTLNVVVGTLHIISRETGKYLGTLSNVYNSAVMQFLRPGNYINAFASGRHNKYMGEIYIDFYGPMNDHARKFGEFLLKQQIYLNPPAAILSNYEYCNPQSYVPKAHMFDSLQSGTSRTLPSSQYVAVADVSDTIIVRSEDIIKDQINSIYNSLSSVEDLEQVEPDARLLTPLYPHQKQALYFMLEKEKSIKQIPYFRDTKKTQTSTCESMILWRKDNKGKIKHVITSQEWKGGKPRFSKGGILADDMGLGKTIEVISLILHRQSESDSSPSSKEQLDIIDLSVDDVPATDEANSQVDASDKLIVEVSSCDEDIDDDIMAISSDEGSEETEMQVNIATEKIRINEKLTNDDTAILFDDGVSNKATSAMSDNPMSLPTDFKKSDMKSTKDTLTSLPGVLNAVNNRNSKLSLSSSLPLSIPSISPESSFSPDPVIMSAKKELKISLSLLPSSSSVATLPSSSIPLNLPKEDPLSASIDNVAEQSKNSDVRSNLFKTLALPSLPTLPTLTFTSSKNKPNVNKTVPTLATFPTINKDIEPVKSTAFVPIKSKPVEKTLDETSSTNIKTEKPSTSSSLSVQSFNVKDLCKPESMKDLKLKNSEIIVSSGTLIVCPLSTVSNWEEQIKSHVKKGTFKIFIYHGRERAISAKALAKYDIVITTYNLLSIEFAREIKSHETNARVESVLHRVNWFRIVLDEAHIIKESNTKMALSACKLISERRWCLTGTPIQNRLDDLYSLVKFLKLEPFSSKNTWSSYISKVIKPTSNSKEIGVARLQTIMKSITIRRTKNSKINGSPILQLPPRIDHIKKITLSKTEQDYYRCIQDEARELFETDLRKNYAGILQIMLRLRQICVHHKLFEYDLAVVKPFTPKIAFELYSAIKENDDDDFCACCNLLMADTNPVTDNLEDEEFSAEKKKPLISKCGHLYCRDCFDRSFKEETIYPCSTCQTPLIKTDIINIPMEDIFEYEIDDGIPYKSSSKIEALVDDLKRVRSTSMDSIKSIVFSQWTTALNIIGVALKNEGFKFVKLDGAMSRENRSTSIEKFKNDPSVTIFLISIKAGGVGLNLTTASRVYIVEPYWNPAVEQQAIDRVHRLGQRKPVEVVRLIVEDSIENKLVEIQKKKNQLAQLTLNDKHHKEDKPHKEEGDGDTLTKKGKKRKIRTQEQKEKSQEARIQDWKSLLFGGMRKEEPIVID